MLYRWVRDLHLYFGLFVSPFVLVFAASVIYLNHGKLAANSAAVSREHRNLTLPEGLEKLKGRDAVDRVRSLLPQLNLSGEIGVVRQTARGRLTFPVTTAATEATVDVDLAARTANVTTRATTLWEALAYLHKMPGPHLAAIRGNWAGTQIWRLLADGTVYLLLFLTMSGLYLWWTIRAERRIGIALLSLGGATLGVLIYAAVR